MKIAEKLRWFFFHITMPEALRKDAENSQPEEPAKKQEPALEKDGFLWFLDGSLRSRLDLDKYVTSVGRLNCMDCCLAEPWVSDRHVEFIREPDGRYFVKDTSVNGETYLNNTRISGKKLELLPGNEVCLGEAPYGVRMVFQRRLVPFTPGWNEPMGRRS